MESAEWKAGKTGQILAVLLLLLYSTVYAENTIDKFTKKADDTRNALSAGQEGFDRLKTQYNHARLEIQKYKSIKDTWWLPDLVIGIKLKYYLNAGNNLAYKMYAAETRIRELKEDYFTFVSVIIDEYNAALRECAAKKCGALKDLYDKRKKWSDVVKNFEDVLNIDLSGIELVNNYNTGAEKDIKEYLQKKIIQAEQRIYILDEEKQVNDTVEKAGLVIDKKDKAETVKKLDELKKLKADLSKELAKMK